ncbi:MAG: matrixin family metalloprotease [Sandaracinus sp.]
MSRLDRSPWTSAALAIAALTFGLAALTPARAHAYCRMVTGDGRQPADFSACAPLATEQDHYLFWSHRCSELSISSALPPRSLTIAQVQDVFRTAASTWEDIDCGGGLAASPRFHIDVLDGTNACTRAGHNGRGNNVSSVMFVQDGNDWARTRGWSPIAFAVTLAWHLESTGEIVDVDMEINESRGVWTICDPSGCVDGGSTCPVSGCGRDGGPVDLQNVVTHELGHYFGIGHTTADHPDATMYASAQFGELTMRDLSTDDVSAICDTYPEGSLPETCDPTPAGGLALDCQSHDCGCGVPGSGSSGDRAPWIVALALAAISAGRIARRRARR